MGSIKAIAARQGQFVRLPHKNSATEPQHRRNAPAIPTSRPSPPPRPERFLRLQGSWARLGPLLHAGSRSGCHFSIVGCSSTPRQFPWPGTSGSPPCSKGSQNSGKVRDLVFQAESRPATAKDSRNLSRAPLRITLLPAPQEWNANNERQSLLPRVLLGIQATANSIQHTVLSCGQCCAQIVEEVGDLGHDVGDEEKSSSTVTTQISRVGINQRNASFWAEGLRHR